MKEETETQRSYVNISMIPQQVSGGTRISNPGLSDGKAHILTHYIRFLGPPSLSTTGWVVQTTEMYFLTLLEAGSLRSRCWHG